MWGGVVHSTLKASHFFIALLQGVTGMDGQPGPKGNVVSPRGHIIWLVAVFCGHSPCLAVEVCISWELGQESGHLSL